jgi:hypothetical protein
MLVSPVFFVFTSILWCLDLAVGSIVAYKRDPKFWVEMDSMPFSQWMNEFASAQLPHSAWVYILAGLTWVMVLSLCLCTINWFFTRKRRARGMAEVLVHLGFMLVFAGFILGCGWGERAQNIAVTKDQRVIVSEMGVGIVLDGVEIVRNSEGKELDTVSLLTLTDLEGNTLTSGTARLNHPLIYGSTVVYPQGGGERSTGATIEVTGSGPVEVTRQKPYTFADGMHLRLRGTLEAGQRYERFAGPGAYVVLVEKNGREIAGAFVGALPMFKRARLGNRELTWSGAIKATEAVFHVHRDPGVWLVLAGALILGLGTIWAMGGFFRKT